MLYYSWSEKIQRMISLVAVVIVVAMLSLVFLQSRVVFAAGMGQKIADKARELAWPYGTSSSTFKSKPTDAFVQATERAGTPNDNDCLSFVKTVVIDSGADTGFPSGSESQESALVEYMSSSSKWEQINTTNESDLKSGDILVSADTSGQGRNHIFVYVGNSESAGANLDGGGWYGRIAKLADEWDITEGNTPFYYDGIQYKVFRSTSLDNSSSGTSGKSLSTGGSKLSEGELEEFAQNNIMFYDPSGCTDANGTVFCTTPSGNDITWIGDSYSENSTNKAAVEAKYSGIYYDGKSGRMFTDDSERWGSSGLNIIKNEIKENLRNYLVFALGTNTDAGSKDAMASNIDDLVATVKNYNSNTKIILVSPITNNDSVRSTYDAYHEAMQAATEKYDNVVLADWYNAAKDHLDEYFDDHIASGYSDNSTHPNSKGYEKWIGVIEDAIPKDCTAGLLPGNNIAEKVWNYFVQANIEGVSDNAAAIAGIMGNLYTESGLNPFMNGESGEYYRGLYMLNSNSAGSLWNDITTAVGSNYWKFYGWWCGISDYPDGGSCADSVLTQNNVPQDAIDAAIKMELDYMVLGEINGQKVSNQGFHSEFEDFVEKFSVISDKSSPRSYAELFLVVVEIAYETSSVSGQAPQDAGVRAFGISQGHERWQGAKARGDDAEEIFNRYANLGTPTVTSTTSSGDSTVSAASSGGYHKYDDLTDNQLWDLSEVAIHENSSNMTAFKNELSIMANLAEANGSQPASGDNLWNYVSSSGWFSTSNYANGSHDENVDSKYLDAARDVLMNGNRTLPVQILEHDCIGDLDWLEIDGAKHEATNAGECNGRGLENTDYYVANKTKVHNASGSTWVFYGWMGGEPGMGDPMGYFADNPPDSTVSSKQETSEGVCDDNSNTNGNGGAGIADAAVKMSWPVQAGQGDESHVGKCKNSSGTWETYSAENYPFSCPTNARDLYREQLNTWLPGDNGMDCGKFVTTVLRYTKTADTTDNSSLESYFRTDDMWEKLADPSTDKLKPGDVFFQPSHVGIYVGDYGGTYGTIASASQDERVGQVSAYLNESTTTSAWRYKGGSDGLTKEQAEKLADNYNNNVGNWDGKVAQEGNYCQGSSCASRYSNCTLFSAFFAEMFTDIGFGHGWPDGINVVDTLVGMGFEKGTKPKPFSVFSTSTYRTPSGNHTGVVVGVEGDKIAIVEAGYPGENAVYIDYTDVSGEDIWYAYLDSRLDYSKLMGYINQ